MIQLYESISFALLFIFFLISDSLICWVQALYQLSLKLYRFAK